MKCLFASFFLALLFKGALAEATCFHEHVKEGRALNRERRQDYINWARDHDLALRARLVSHAFINLETLMLPMSRVYDLRARDYEGTGLFCDDFIPISETPSFSPTYTQIPEHSFDSSPAFLKLYEKKIRADLKRQRWDLLRAHSLEAIAAFPNPETHCLTRHFVESVGRVSALAPRHIRRAKEQGLKEPAKLIDSMIRFHLFGLGYALKIDALAAPLQQQGIPMVCQDIPFIPIPELTR